MQQNFIKIIKNIIPSICWGKTIERTNYHHILICNTEAIP
uniref:Uncharacterized protein n=1 Tax=Arundo donax TaxID=35708 RepID=A0A0A8Z2B2_ARUDO